LKKYHSLLLKMSRVSALCALALVPLVFMLQANEAFETAKALAFYLFVSVSAGSFFASAAVDPALVPKLRVTSLTFPAAGLLLAYSFSLIKSVSINPHSFPLNFQFFMLIAFCSLLFLLLTSAFSKKDIVLIISAALIPHAITALYGLFQYMGFDWISWVSFGEGRVYSTLGNPDYMAAQFTLLLPVSAALFMMSSSLAKRVFYAALCLAFIFLIIVSHGRGAWLAMAFSFIAFPFALAYTGGSGIFKKYRAFFTGAAAVLVIMAVIFMVPNPLNKNSILERIKHGFDRTSDSVAVRLFYWESALRMAELNPFFGVGPGGFSLNTALYQRMVLDRWEKTAPDMAEKVQPHVELYAHNDILQNLSETGYIGLSAFIWFILTMLYLALKPPALSVNPYIYLKAALFTSVAAFIVNGLLNFPWRVMPTISLLYTLAACIALTSGIRAYSPGPALSRSIAVIFIFISIYVPVTQARSLYANISIKNGQAHFAQKNYTAARDTFEKALKSGPRGTDRIELLLYAGNAHHALSNADRGIEYYLEGIKMFPNFIESHYNVANIYMQTGRTDKAIEEFNKVLALNPKFSAAHNNLANIYFNRGDFAKAREMYALAVKTNPKSVEARYNLGAALFRDKKYKEAKEQLLEALKIDPNYELAKQWAAQLQRMGY